MSNYLKAIVAIATAGLTVLLTAVSDSTITSNEWVLIALAVVGAVGVYAAPNTVAGPA